MDINVKIYVNGKNYKTLCKTVINADAVQCEISFDNHSFDVEFDNTAIVLKKIDGIAVDTVKTLRFKANFTSMKKFKWDLMEIVTEIVGLLAERHIGYKNMGELYDNAIKNHCIKPETTEPETATETKPETATDPEPAEAEATTEKAWTVTQFPHVVRTFDKNGKMVYESFFETAEKAYDEYVDIIENSKENLPHGEELTVVRYADGRIMCSETIKGTCIYNSMQKSKATEDTADQSETAESDTKQYECENVVQVAHKVADLTNTLCDREAWKGYCNEVKRDGSSWFDYTAFDSGGNEFDVSIFLGYDQQSQHYFVSVDYEKCPVPDMPGGA